MLSNRVDIRAAPETRESFENEAEFGWHSRDARVLDGNEETGDLNTAQWISFHSLRVDDDLKCKSLAAAGTRVRSRLQLQPELNSMISCNLGTEMLSP